MRRFSVMIVFALVGCGGGSNPNPTPSPEPAPTRTVPLPTPTVPSQPLNPPAPTTGRITGAVTNPAKKGEMLVVGYVEVAGTGITADMVGMSVLGGGGDDGWAESDTHKPRNSALRFEKGKARYEHTTLPPGTYLVYASVRNGPTTWAKVELKAGETVTRDLTIEAGKGGTVEVTLPADFSGEVKLGPSDLAPGEDPNYVVGRVASDLGLGAKADKGKATVKDVPPGKYTLFAIPGVLSSRGTVEVKAGETAKAEIKDVK